MIEAAQPYIREYAHRSCRTLDDVDDRVLITNEGLSRAFRTALLLTASAEQAEEALLEGIRAMDPLEVSDQSLWREAVTASIAAKLQEEGVEEPQPGSSLLPVELLRVLRLSRDLRHCFVLRVLAGLSREKCALILRTGTQQIDELVRESVQFLAGLAQGEWSTRS